MVTGPEINLPEGYVFHDNNGHPRSEIRLAWWRNEASTWRETALLVPDPMEFPSGKLPEGDQTETYYASAPPVLVGHYKMRDTPTIERLNAACLDYPDSPCLYRWRGEPKLSQVGLEEVSW